MELFFWAVLGLLSAGYFALAGYDYGAGMLLRFLGRDEAGRRRALGAVGPFFLGNEVWLVAAVGLLFGAFPRWESKVFAGAYLIVVVLLLGLVSFTAAVQLRSRRPDAGRGAWDGLITVGALVTTVCWGLFLGVLVRGLPADGPVPLADPYLAVWGLGFVALLLLHGATFLAVRGDAALAARARRIALRLVPVVAGFVAAVALWTGLSPSITSTVDSALPGPAVLGVAVLALAATFTGLLTRRPRLALPATMVLSALPVTLAGTLRFPDLVVSMDLYEAAAADATLDVLAVVTPPAVLLVALTQWLTWRWQRRPVDQRTLLHF
ncbi:cytochrome d ubiquinol oxidase subunit II [Amycolatopsis suaedae]|uniref:Cytochrome d ubiquinol oxidase subunit II n=1 Tax=Amycolatopsis suaedae TaxID=2510978 RepID=A0A4Q7JCE3_9PSEU|nr:cytochrome d ubiquinol oxidase subunit II [Amycolatopsis suaedae]RZQ65580.1 cytochrome d ubiquinol oxidase subunit II [Amycolatopsis suaedae]